MLLCVFFSPAVDICTTSSVYSRRNLSVVLLQIISRGGTATNVHPAKEEVVGLVLNPKEAAAQPWQKFVLPKKVQMYTLFQNLFKISLLTMILDQIEKTLHYFTLKTLKWNATI